MKIKKIEKLAKTLVDSINHDLEQVAEANDVNSFRLSAELIRQLVNIQTNLTLTNQAD